MKAITTKRVGATNTQPARYIASDSDNNRVSVSEEKLYRQLDPNADRDDYHRCAALALCAKMGWTGEIIGGGVKDGMVWVFLTKAGSIYYGIDRWMKAENRWLLRETFTTIEERDSAFAELVDRHSGTKFRKVIVVSDIEQ